MIASKEMSSLRWFLSTPSAANFPQAMSSPGLSALQNAFSKFVKDFFLLATNVSVSDRELWLNQAKEAVAVELKLREQFNSDTAFELVGALRNIKSLFDSSGGGDSVERNSAVHSYRALLACLVVYAKDSKDFTFKSQVLDLVRDFETK